MRVLAIDTALAACAAAVLDTDHGIVASESLPMVRGHAEALIPLERAAVDAFPSRVLTGEEARRLSHGGRLPGTGAGPGPVAAFGPDGALIALVEEKDGQARPLAVFVP